VHGGASTPLRVSVENYLRANMHGDGSDQPSTNIHADDSGAFPDLHVDLDLAVDLNEDATEGAIRRDHAR
jgi:hypothetical protein